MSTDPKFQKIDPLPGATISYAVLVDGERIGTVSKCKGPGRKNTGSRQRPDWRPYTATWWECAVDGGPEVDEPFDRRSDAASMVVHISEREIEA